MDLSGWPYLIGIAILGFIAFKIALTVVRYIIYLIVAFLLYQSGFITWLWQALVE